MAEEEKEGNGQKYELHSPIIGIFYEASAPGEKPFVRVGDIVQPGKDLKEYDSLPTLCILEAMKTFNDINFEWTMPLRLVAIHVNNGDVVEANQLLMTFEPA